jgi:DNA-binding MarR family transcriptional regulator
MLILRNRSSLVKVAEQISQDHTLLFQVWLLANSTRALLDGALRTGGLDADGFALYSVLARPGGATPTELARMMALPPTTVSSIVRRLERRNHAQRAPNPDDARSYRIELTRLGRDAHAKAGRIFIPVLAKVEANLGMPVSQAENVLRLIEAAGRATTENN